MKIWLVFTSFRFFWGYLTYMEIRLSTEILNLKIFFLISMDMSKLQISDLLNLTCMKVSLLTPSAVALNICLPR